MKKTISTPCGAALALLALMWMGVAEGWNDAVVAGLWLACVYCIGVSFGGIAHDFMKRREDREGGE